MGRLGSFFYSSDSGSTMAEVHIRSLFLLIQKSFLHTPAKAAAAVTETLSPSSPPPQCKHSNFTVEFLVKSCGFPLESALFTSERLRLDEKKQEKYQSVVDLFRSQGFNQTQMAKVIGQKPHFLQYSAEENLKPKFDFLKENGFLGEFLLEIIVKNPTILAKSVDYNMKPHLEILKNYLASREKIIAAVRKIPRLLTCDFNSRIDFLIKEGVPFVGIAKILVWQPNSLLQNHNRVAYAVNAVKSLGLEPIDFLIKEGVPFVGIAKILVWQPNSLLQNHNRVAYAVNAVKSLGLEPSSAMFIHVFNVMVLRSESTLNKKKEVLRSLGWTTEEILLALKIFPKILTLSEENIKRTMDFYVNTVNLEPQSIVQKPFMLGFGIDSRLRPRYNVFKVLESKKLIQMNIDPKWFQISDKDFLEQYVIKYKDEVPGLLDIYGAHKRSMEA